MSSKSRNTKKKKPSYKDYEKFVLELNDKVEIVATRVFEVQNYFIGYLEYKKENIKFGDWMNKRIKEAASELQKNEQSDGKNMERSTVNQG